MSGARNHGKSGLIFALSDLDRSLARDINYLSTVMVPKMNENSVPFISRVPYKLVYLQQFT